ncbi:hypothetical protein UUU_22050 [Klebsiella pneumoniae subsp. pneumoniae DSM 30104 = JCM 1662 = NBRC 14940]|nr:hypothetical protein UUU_22050 [Klebsiella pneumoniae subsp. pneumoniae DSM 30104 = JCM 1662 = NBRC 14940]
MQPLTLLELFQSLPDLLVLHQKQRLSQLRLIMPLLIKSFSHATFI